jgi:hypothetical protein
MVSSEVQRTLVKSPPELWAEISDPESLARHLGEFGEIRITRVQPEQKVEWEADDAHGSVVIKPSGWGTKVKLTVTRELAPPGEAAATADAEFDAAEDNVETTLDAAVDGSVQPEAEAQPTVEVQPEATTVEPAVEADSEAQLEDEAEPTHQPAVGHPLDALLGDELPPADAEPADAEPAKAASTETEHDEAQPVTEQAHDVEPEHEPRRGFFARLFGRRRAARPTPREAFEAAALVTGSGDAHAESSSHDHRALAGQTDELAARLAEPTIVEPTDELAAEPTQASGETAPSAELAVTSERQPAPELIAKHETPSAAAQEATSETAATDGEPVADVTEEPVDIAAEIRAAEEVAAEQVTAVLTGVLDRLGAAHHRPFSRS